MHTSVGESAAIAWKDSVIVDMCFLARLDMLYIGLRVEDLPCRCYGRCTCIYLLPKVEMLRGM